MDDSAWSPKAWMSVPDTGLCEAILERLARATPEPLRIVEWGSGRSSLHYSSLLRELGVPFHWMSIEYDRGFFEKTIAPEIAGRSDVTVTDAIAVPPSDWPRPGPADQLLEFVLFDAGQLSPFEADRAADRLADLDAYVTHPGRRGGRLHFALVDGRKRRRCLLEAAGLLAPGGVALLHDCYRFYYQCAWESFTSGRRIGEMLWVGSMQPRTALDKLLTGLETGDPE
jgi:hypothetical protein